MLPQPSQDSRLRGNDGGWVWGGVKVSGCLGKGSATLNLAQLVFFVSAYRAVGNRYSGLK